MENKQDPQASKRFGLIGAAGYVAPRHLRAIKQVGGDLVAALDPFDSVGILDSYFPRAAFFTEFERFDRHLDKCYRQDKGIDYLSICSPNYLHDAHIRLALRSDADAICEKPLVLNPWNAEALLHLEQQTQRQVYTILQLRHHQQVISLRKKVQASPKDQVFDIDLTYITPRGNWYYTSWKGDLAKSGGIATNIGIHFFDMLQWIFGSPTLVEVHLHQHDRAAGYLEMPKARVRWFLSINASTSPSSSTNRALKIDEENFDFSKGFEDLHSHAYQEILAGNGFSIEDALPAVDLVYQIRNAPLKPLSEQAHPLAKLPLSKHPFRHS